MINRNDYIKNIKKDWWKYKMLNLDDIVSNKKTSSSERNDWPFRMLIIGPSGSGKTNTLLHLINNLHPIDKIYLYAKEHRRKKVPIFNK